MGACKNLFIIVINYIHATLEIVAHFFFQLCHGRKGQQMPPITDLILLDSATTIAHKIRTKKITSVEVLNSYINRIDEINALLNCVVADRFEDALKEAKAADELVKSGTISENDLAKSKPFLGVPFTTKDCLAVKGMIHTGGLYMRRNFKAVEDAEAVANLRNAGAIPIALTNVPELCMWWESANLIHGRTSNPYDTNRIVGGSSGGEACNQAAAGSAFGLGSDIGGSIRIPAFFNGVFGHKPSKAVVSNAGQYPAPVSAVQKNMLGLGPICRRAEDLLPIFKVIVKKEVRDQLKLDEKVDLKKIKFYYQQNNMGIPFVTPVQREIKDLFKKITLHLGTALKIKAQEVKLEKFRKSSIIWLADMNHGNGPTFEEQLCNLEGKINAPLEMLKWCVGMSNHTFVALLTAVVEKFSLKPNTPKYDHIIDQKKFLIEEIAQLLGDDGVFIYPTHPTAAPYHNESIFKAMNFTYTGIINSLGFPSTHCPMGLNSEGLPIGLQVISNLNNDRLCLAVAMELEKAFGGWVPPQVVT